MFFPVLVPDKHATALALQRSGIDALEFWNEGMGPGDDMCPDTRFLRAHVLELPIHQDLTPRQIAYMARETSALPMSHGSGAPYPPYRATVTS